MCGIIGVAGNIYQSEKKVFKMLHFLDIVRGEHSSGVASIQTGNKVELHKAVGTPFDLWFENPKVFDDKDHTINGYNHKVLIGHNRYATMGAKTKENAHPFTHGNITGVHNGTLEKTWLHKLDGSDKFEVDSEAIFYSLDKNGLEKTISSLVGAWALVWWDAKDESMHFIRNSKRPLFYVWNKDGDALYWASEEWMLKVAAAKEGENLSEVHSFEADKHYSIEVKGSGNLKTVKLMVDNKLYKGFTPPVTQVSYGYNAEDYATWWEDNVGGYPIKPKVKTFTQAQNTNVSKNEKAGASSTSSTFSTIGEKATDTLNKLNADWEAARKLINEIVEFTIYGERTSERSGTYLVAGSKSIPDTYEIRLYAEGNKRLKEWQVSSKTYKGRLKSIATRWNNKTNKSERYLTVDLRSVDEGTSPPEEPRPAQQSTIILGSDLEHKIKINYKGYKGAKLSHAEFMDIINCGCVWCGEKIPPIEYKLLTFVRKDRVACHLCKTDALAYYGS